jgi:hypothetical protein
MSVNYSTIGEMTIGQRLIADRKIYRYEKNISHPTLGFVRVFMQVEEEADKNGHRENRLFPKSKDSQRVLVRSLNTFEL